MSLFELFRRSLTSTMIHYDFAFCIYEQSTILMLASNRKVANLGSTLDVVARRCVLGKDT